MSEAAGMEVRIHGIGNHGPLDALGSPVLGDGTFLSPHSNDPAVVQPVRPTHDVWFVAWTRSSRAINSFAWYLGLPFTLCNTAGHMRSRGRLGRATAAFAIVIGCLLTLGAFLWSVVEVENLYYGLGIPKSVWVVHDVPKGCLIVMTLLWVGLLARRAVSWNFADDELRPAAQVLAAVQCLLVVAAAVLVWLKHPATATNACWGFDKSPCLAEKADWATTLGWVTIAVAGVGVLALALLSLIDRRTNWMGGSAFPHLGTGLALAAAALLLHLAASGTVLLFDVVAHYLNSMNPWHWGGPRAIPLLRQYDDSHLIYRGSDTLAATWAPLGVLLVLMILALQAFGKVTGSTGERQARVIHKVITGPRPLVFPICVFVVTLLGSASLVWTWGRMDAVQAAGLSRTGPEGLDEVVHVITVMGMHLLIVFLPFALLSKNVRATVAVLSDVVGYWPIVHHPLAAPPYRFDVVNTSATQIAALRKPVVIVGHSQGSVLAVDILKRLSQQPGYAPTQHALVTCGSPLASLYSTYFPHYFPVEVRSSTRALVKEWRNFWRSTDPIATKLGLDDGADIETLDGNERTDGPPYLRVHSDYWVENDQKKAVDEVLSGLGT